MTMCHNKMLQQQTRDQGFPRDCARIKIISQQNRKSSPWVICLNFFTAQKNHQLARERPQKLPKGCLTSPWSNETTRESTRRQSWISFPPTFLFFLSIKRWFNFFFIFTSFKYRFHCLFYVCVWDSESKKKPRENRKKEEFCLLIDWMKKVF